MSVFTTARDLCARAAYEIGAASQGEVLSAGDAAFLLQNLNLIVSQWNANRPAIYVSEFSTFTLPLTGNPVTIGPTTADWTMAIRPDCIEAANLIIAAGPPLIQNPIAIRNVAWWMNLTTPDISTAFPTDLYYAPDFPNGSLYFWPVPTTAYDVTLQLSLTFGSYTLNTSFSMPDGYDAALMFTLAEWSATGMGKELSPMTVKMAGLARSIIFANNIETVELVTLDAGMPDGSSRICSTFNWYNGLNVARR